MKPRKPWLRWHILRTLLHKEVLRHLANRGGIALVLLLIVASLLLSFFGDSPVQATGALGGIKRCYIDYWKSDSEEWQEWMDHLEATVPPDFKSQVVFRNAPRRARQTADGIIVYEQGSGGIQIRPNPSPGNEQPRYLIHVWHPGQDAGSLAPFEAWFWRETRAFEQKRAARALTGLDPQLRQSIQGWEIERQHYQLKGGLDPRSGIATSLVMFGLFFVCVYLLPSLSCEERERGVLLAQALSPASPREILAARFLFYPLLALLLAAVLAGTYQPAVLTRGFFWLALLVAVAGSMGIGLTIASIARTQRAASMGAMCYLMAVGLLLFICQQSNVPFLPYLALEYHGPRMIHAALGDAVLWYHWLHLVGAAVLAVGWAVAATILFRRRGWQS